MTYALPEYLDWVGWVGAALIILTTVYLFYRQRKKKASDTRSHHIVLLDGFPACHVPVSVTRSEAESIAQGLQGTYTASWAKFNVSYAQTIKHAQIAFIGLSEGIVDPGHPEVLWRAPRDRVLLRLQDSVNYWFARELHNIFRYQMFGMKWIYRVRNGADEKHITDIEQWIEDSFSKEKTEEN